MCPVGYYIYNSFFGLAGILGHNPRRCPYYVDPARRPAVVLSRAACFHRQNAQKTLDCLNVSFCRAFSLHFVNLFYVFISDFRQKLLCFPAFSGVSVFCFPVFLFAFALENL